MGGVVKTGGIGHPKPPRRVDITPNPRTRRDLSYAGFGPSQRGDVPEELRELAPGEYFVAGAAAGDESAATWEDLIAKSVSEDVRATAERRRTP